MSDRLPRQLLSVENISVRFAGVKALSDVSFDVKTGELFAIIGPNGAGKTSLFNVLSRVYQPAEGTVTFDGRDLLRIKAHRIAHVGIARTFQNLGQFPTMTVLDYLLLGRHSRMRSGILLGGLYIGMTYREEQKNRAYCLHLLDLLGMKRLHNYPLGSLPYGLQKRADVARALALKPKLLLLDEPVAGMGARKAWTSRRPSWISMSNLVLPRCWSSMIWRWSWASRIACWYSTSGASSPWSASRGAGQSRRDQSVPGRRI